MGKAKKQNFMMGAFILMMGGIIVKIIGAIFKVPLGNLIKGEGMAYFNNAYDIYTWMYIITTAGLPVAISRMIAESNTLGKKEESKKILRVAFSSFMILGILGTAFIMLFAQQLADGMKSHDSYYAIMAIAPAILFEIVMSSYRGYFQGNQNMTPTAISQILVALCKVGVGYTLALWLSQNGYSKPIIAAGAIFGVTFGTVVGALYLFIRRLFIKKETQSSQGTLKSDSNRRILKRLLMIAIPITIGASVLSVTNLIDAAVVQRRLDTIAGALGQIYPKITINSEGLKATASEIVAAVYGSYSGYARVLFNLPTALIIPMGVGIIPSIAELFVKKDKLGAQKIIASTLRVSVFLSLPAGVGLAVLSKPIMQLLYASAPNEVEIAAPLLTLLGPAVVCVCLVSITNNILQAIGKEWIPVVTMLIGGALKLILNYILVATPNINIMGAPISTNVCYGVITVLNLIFIVKTLGKSPDISGAFVKPIIAATTCGIAAFYSYKFTFGYLGNFTATGFSIIVAALFYFVVLGILKWYKSEDIKMLPKGEKIEKILAKIGWIS